jgi:transcriptional regulator with AAA-type ATPase domain
VRFRAPLQLVIFGRKGSFTGAIQDKIGFLKQQIMEPFF